MSDTDDETHAAWLQEYSLIQRYKRGVQTPKMQTTKTTKQRITLKRQKSISVQQQLAKAFICGVIKW